MARANWPLLALAKSPDRCLTPVQVQKTLFLLGKREGTAVGSHYYKFVPYSYGPFSTDVYRDLDALVFHGFVEAVPAESQRWAEYRITKSGLAAAKKAESATPKKAKEYLERVAPWARSLTFSQLVRAVYEAYPEYRANSVFKY